MQSTAEAKFLGNSATAVMTLQKVNPQATVIQSPIEVYLWLPNGLRCFQRALIRKKSVDIMKRPSVTHAALE